MPTDRTASARRRKARAPPPRHNPLDIMREFMRQRGGVALGIAEGLEWRHLHMIGKRACCRDG
jgi:hypothetical protein